MLPSKLLSLPAVTALNRVIGGYRAGTRTIGIPINTHAELHDFFGEYGIVVADAPSIPKKIRATIERLNTTVAEHPVLKKLLAQVADPRYYAVEQHEPSIQFLNVALRPDGMEIRLVGDSYRLLTTGVNAVAASALASKADALDLVSVQADFERAVSKADDDPAEAITAACSTVESVCKCILDEMSLPHPTNKDIKGLVGEVAKHLKLSPGRDDLPKEWEQDIRQILSGLFNVAGGIGALRTHAGSAHGKGKKAVPADARIARLAVHAASTISLFFIETWQRMAKR
jgi:hypothetical protein